MVRWFVARVAKRVASTLSATRNASPYVGGLSRYLGRSDRSGEQNRWPRWNLSLWVHEPRSLALQRKELKERYVLVWARRRFWPWRESAQLQLPKTDPAKLHRNPPSDRCPFPTHHSPACSSFQGSRVALISGTIDGQRGAPDLFVKTNS